MISKAPNTFLVGAPKAGTTAIFRFLETFPQIAVTSPKEPNYISGLVDCTRQQYLDKFCPSHDGVLIDGTVSALQCYHVAIPRIRELHASPKIIIVLRNPVDRLLSQFQYYSGLGVETREMEEVLLDMRGPATYPWGKEHDCYFEAGLYSKPVAAFRKAFEHVLVLQYEDLADVAKLRQLLAFLAIPAPEGELSLPQANVSGMPTNKLIAALYRSSLYRRHFFRFVPGWLKIFARKRWMKKKSGLSKYSEQILRYYLSDLEALEKEIGTSLAHWK